MNSAIKKIPWFAMVCVMTGCPEPYGPTPGNGSDLGTSKTPDMGGDETSDLMESPDLPSPQDGGRDMDEVHVLRVDVTGPGVVTSLPAGITCPGSCRLEGAQSVVLTASPGPGAQFVSWSGGCSGERADVELVVSAEVTCTANFEEAPVESWTRTVGEGAAHGFSDAVKLPDGSWVVVGYTGVSRGQDALIARLDARGDLLWGRALGTSGTESLESVHLMDTGDLFAVRSLGSTEGLFVRFTPEGEVVYGRRTARLEEGYTARFNHAHAIGGDDFLLSGRASMVDKRMWWGQINAAEGEIAHQSLGSSLASNDYITDVSPTQDGGLLTSTWRRESRRNDEYIVLNKLDIADQVEWSMQSYTSLYENDFSRLLALGSNDMGESFAAGYTNLYGARGLDGLVVKFKEDGTILWQKVIGGPNNDAFASMEPTPAGGVRLFGRYAQEMHHQGWFVELDTNGLVVEQRGFALAPEASTRLEGGVWQEDAMLLFGTAHVNAERTYPSAYLTYQALEPAACDVYTTPEYVIKDAGLSVFAEASVTIEPGELVLEDIELDPIDLPGTSKAYCTDGL